jgi:mannose-6-phosphate isomerase class I
VYGTTAEEFELSRLRLPPNTNDVSRLATGPETLLVLEGSLTLVANECRLPFIRGQAVFIPYGLHYTLQTQHDPALLFKASVPSSTRASNG